VFQLVDRYLPERSPGWPVPKQIYCFDASTNPIPAQSSGTSYSKQLINSNVPFTELICAQIPDGAQFEIDLA
jgi:hypothetical protein